MKIVGKKPTVILAATALVAATTLISSSFAAVIDSTHKYGWGTHIGWVNFKATWGNVDVTDTAIVGAAWSSSYGWINLDPTSAGIDNACNGDISGYAWSWALWWINFANGIIDANGFFQGQADIPWYGKIKFQGSTFKLRTDWRPSCGGVGALAIDNPTDWATTNNDTPAITWNAATPGATINVTAPGGQSCSAIATETGDWSCILTTPLPDGSAVLAATEVTPAGDATATTSIGIIVDTVTPSPITVATPINGSTSNNNTPTITGTGEPGTLFSIFDGVGTLLWTWMVDGSGGYSLTLSDALPDGSNAISVTLADEAGNIAGPVAINFTIDTTAPSAPGIANPTDGLVTNDTTPLFNGTAEPGSTVTLTDGLGNLVWSTTVDANGNWTFTPASSMADGSYTVNAIAADAASNQSSPATTSFTIDSNAPTPLSIIAPANGSTIADSTPTITWTGEPGTIFSIFDGGGTLLWTWTVDGSGGYSFAVPTSLSEGTNTVSVSLTDAAGNTTGPIATTFDIDTTAPAAPVIVTPTTGSTTTDATPTIMGTAEPGSTVTLTDGLGSAIGSTTADESGSWTFTPTADLLEGSRSINATATDPAGNTSSSTSTTFTIDTTAPIAPVLTSIGGDTDAPYLTTDTTPEIVGTGTPGDIVTIDDGLGHLIGTALVDAGGNWSIVPVMVLPEGSTSIVITPTDPAGNTGSVINASITVDATAPATPTIATPLGGSTTTDATPAITGTAEAWATVTIATATGALIGTAIADASGNYSFAPSIPFDDGPVSIRVTATDPAGNVSPTATSSFVIDSTASWAPVVTSPTDGSTTQDTTPTISGTADAGATLTIYSETGAVLGTTTVDAGRNWTFTPTTLFADGTVILSFTQTDAAGNVSPATTLTFVVNAWPASVQARGWGWGGAPRVSWNPAIVIQQPATPVAAQDDIDSNPVTEVATEHDTAVPSIELPEPSNDQPSVRHVVAIDGNERTYTIIDDPARCPVIDQILDPSYRSDFESAFVDINQSNVPRFVSQLEKVGVLNGRADGYFEPSSKISRAEFLKILLRTHCYEYRQIDTRVPRFSDVTPWSWESQVAELGHNLGIINGDRWNAGDDLIFRPSDQITRAEAIKMLMNIALVRTGSQPTTGFTDVPRDKWFEPYASRAEYLGIVDPEEQAYFYRPDTAMTRDGAVQRLTKLIRLYR